MSTGQVKVKLDVEVKGVYEDLRAMESGLDEVITDALQIAGKLVVAAAVPLTPYKAEDHEHVHLRDSFTATTKGLVATIGSSLPQAPLFEFGGSINPTAGGGKHPKGLLAKRSSNGLRTGGEKTHSTSGEGYVIHVPARHMVGKAFDAMESGIEADLEAMLDRLQQRLHLS